MPDNSSKRAPKVRLPRSNPLGSHRNPPGFVNPPPVKRPAVRNRVYTKSTLREDPSQFYEYGFGTTGMEGGY